ncbi:MAG: zf-HC2 domain-containing protein [Clostridia bacterium]|nr:zf-HC2 domain-containing protein [Clostridia bacterium]
MANDERKILDCDIVRDLLELYHDKIVSDTTERAVSEHLCECESCKAEYEKLTDKLPETHVVSPVKDFNKLMKKKKIRQVSATTVICLTLSLLIALTAHQLLTRICVKQINDIEVHRVYRYSTDEGDKFFVMYSTKNNSKRAVAAELKEVDGRTALCIEMKCPAVTDDYHLPLEQIDTFSIGDAERSKSCEALIVSGRVVWTKETGNQGEIPEYVYAYEKTGNEPTDKLRGDDWTWFVEVDSLNLDAPENHIAFVYYPYANVPGRENEDVFIWWSLDGEVLKDTIRVNEEAAKTE